MDRWHVFGVETPSYNRAAALRRVYGSAPDNDQLPNTPSPRTMKMQFFRDLRVFRGLFSQESPYAPPAPRSMKMVIFEERSWEAASLAAARG
ncbi:MAG: hypothetical protein RMM98_17880 [Acidobacteriota bacterium]|nr:hypothetical protein [Blastocatellia bacterium]MDW8241474.1 hypothetical protein [Acidobacteriota bacterium]